MFEKINLNAMQTCHNLFKTSGVSVWFKSHHIFECHTLSSYRASTMSHQTAPTPYYRQPSPPLYGSKTFTHWERNSTIIKLPYCKGNTCMVEEPTHIKQLSLNHICKIGLRKKSLNVVVIFPAGVRYCLLSAFHPYCPCVFSLS